MTQTDPFCEPEQIPGTPNVSVGMEQFNDTPVVNGVAYPTLTLEPRAYRFRILSVANDRFFNLQWYVGDAATASTDLNTLGQAIGPTEVALNPAELAAAQLDPNIFPTPVQGTPGPDWIQIGTEGGFLPSPVVVDGQQPTTWITDPTRFDVGNVDQHSLLLAPAERADVIVDFSQFAGQTLILYNDAPAAFPARVSSYDYYTGAPDLSPIGAPTILPGYGPNTRTVMQIKIAASNPAPTYNLANLQAAFRHNANGTGVFESGQHPIIVGQAAYNTAYGTSFASGSNCNAPGSVVQRCDGFVRVNDTTQFGFNTLLGQNTKMTIPLQPKAIHDEMNASSFDEFGRMTANLGLEAQPPAPGAQNVTLYPYVNPPTELIDATNLPKNDVIYDANGQPVSDIKITPISDAADGTQIWRITHNGVDTHPIHFHLYDVQLVNRVTWDNIIIPPDANELGWKDTVRIAPLEDTIVALRPIIPELPWELPNAIRSLSPMLPVGVESMMFNSVDPQGVPTVPIINDLVNFGWEYVFHCHILSHEEMDMMRPVSVAMPPVAPDGLTFDLLTTTLSWNDNSIAETAYLVQKSIDGGVSWIDLGTILSPLADPNTTGIRSFFDALFDPSVVSLYRVVAQNTVGYGLEFPSMTVQSMSAELAVDAMIPPQAPTGLSAAYQAGSGVVLAWTDNATNETGFGVERSDDGGVTFTQIATLGVDVTSYTDATVAFEMTYIYRVFAFNAFGSSAPSNDAPVTTPLATPTNLVVTYLVGPNVSLTWLDNSFVETGYTVERSVNDGPFALLMSLGIDSTSYTDTSVADNNAYAYRVYAFDGVGSSAFSNEAAIVTLPAAPTNLSAVYQAGTGVALTWTDNAAVETGYRVERSTDGVTFSLLVELGANVVAYTDAPVAFETTYTYRVYAFNGSGSSVFSNDASVITPLATPTNLVASYVAGTGISLTWLDNSFAETSYVVERSENGGLFASLVSLGVGSTSYSDATVAFDKTYTYRVYATGLTVNSAFSNEAAVVTPPNAPTNLTATTGRQGNRARFDLSWTDSSVTETGFTIQYSTDSNFLTNVITVNLAANATSFTTGNILPRNTTYFIRIQAVNGTGSSDWVSISISTP